uniref:Uncharacterized protein n=1 Tax=Marseillevirus LCMAC103 TaxID=2506604 RepID=A0A481YV69_9VIRU|nr:MAG: hypothetical protein LCMAC103_01290 [Marseillevirus LCMAC103]
MAKPIILRQVNDEGFLWSEWNERQWVDHFLRNRTGEVVWQEFSHASHTTDQPWERVTLTNHRKDVLTFEMTTIGGGAQCRNATLNGLTTRCETDRGRLKFYQK